MDNKKYKHKGIVKAYQYNGVIDAQKMQEICNQELCNIEMFELRDKTFRLVLSFGKSDCSRCEKNYVHHMDLGDWIVNDGLGMPRLMSDEIFKNLYEIEEVK